MVSDYLPENKFARVLLYVVGGVALAVVIGLVLGILVQWLWNYTIAVMFDLPPITYWQAFALFILAKLLFGFGGGGTQSGNKKQERNKPEDQVELPGDETFREYWQTEGKAAYETFLANKDRSAD